MANFKHVYYKNENVGRTTVMFDYADHHDIVQVAAEVGLEYMQMYSHPNEIVLPIDPLQYGGGRDMSTCQKYIPMFFAAKQEGVIMSLAGGHNTSDHLFRLRVLHTFKPYANENLGATTCAALLNHAKTHLNCNAAWAEIKAVDLDLYKSLGFEITRPHRLKSMYYVSKIICS